MKASRKIPLIKREDSKQRSVTFTKRRCGLFSKASELCKLFNGVQLSILVGSVNRVGSKVYSFGCDHVLDSFLNDTFPQPVESITEPDTSLAHDDKCRDDIKFWREIDQNLNFDNVDSVEELSILEEKIVALKESVKNKLNSLNAESSGSGSQLTVAATTDSINHGVCGDLEGDGDYFKLLEKFDEDMDMQDICFDDFIDDLEDSRLMVAATDSTNYNVNGACGDFEEGDCFSFLAKDDLDMVICFDDFLDDTAEPLQAVYDRDDSGSSFCF